MRFMMLMLSNADERAAPGSVATAGGVAAMSRYNESLSRAGVLLAADGLHPPSTGARVHFAGARPRVVEAPFLAAREVLAGYWLIEVRSREDAIEWARRCPGHTGNVLEVRQVRELAPVPPALQSGPARR